MKRMLFALATIVLVVSCSNEYKEDKDSKIEKPPVVVGKYIYESADGVYHMDRECFNLVHSKGHRPSARYIPTSTVGVDDVNNKRMCTRCISQEQYELLSDIAGIYSKSDTVSKETGIKWVDDTVSVEH